jgi:hypothetical protein
LLSSHLTPSIFCVPSVEFVVAVLLLSHHKWKVLPDDTMGGRFLRFAPHGPLARRCSIF